MIEPADLMEDEKYLFALMMDDSGIDQLEFLWHDRTSEDEVFRAWPFQVYWWRTPGQKIITAGCIAADHMVTVRGGNKPIQDVKIGDEVWTHKRRWRKVTNIFDNGVRDTITIYTDNSTSLTLTPGHLLYGKLSNSYSSLPYVSHWIPAYDMYGRYATYDDGGYTNLVKIVDSVYHGPVNVYDIEVEEDHSFVVDGIVVHNSRSCGKALDVDTPILTFNRGWVTMGDIVVGDVVFDEKGDKTFVTEAYDVLFDRDCLEIFFVPDVVGLDPVSIVADVDHEWLVSWSNDTFLATSKELSFGYKLDGPTASWVVADIKKVISRPVRCIEVDSPSHLFCVNDFVPTHNSLSVAARSFAMPFVAPGDEMIITAPDGDRLNMLLEKVEDIFISNFFLDAMVRKIKHRPFHCSFKNGARIVGRIPRQDGTGVQGAHPLFLMHDEACLPADTLILTSEGDKPIQNVEVGDKVWTHKQRWRKVTKSWDHGLRGTVVVSSDDCPDLIITPNHKMWGRKDIGDEDGWIKAEDMQGGFLTRLVDGQMVPSNVTSVTPHNVVNVYDIEVEDDHSFVADGIVVHNSTYPPRGWKELVETVKMQNPRAKWLSFGVTMGPGNIFDDIISGNITEGANWKVVRTPAMYRPNWTESERQEKIAEYGSYEDIDYQRNVLGDASGADSFLVNLHKLMGCVDQDKLGEYMNSTYYSLRITDADVREFGQNEIVHFFDPPEEHDSFYKDNIWIGMDYGETSSPSCIMVFREANVMNDGNIEKKKRLQLVTRIMLSKITPELQNDLVLHIIKYYRPASFAFDYHGMGSAMYYWIQSEVRKDPEVSWILDRIKGFSFSEKIIVEFDDKININTYIKDDWKRAAIYKLTKEAAMDYLRSVINTDNIWLPYDVEVLGDIKSVPRKEVEQYDEYMKPRRKKGQHILDGIYYALLAYYQNNIDDVIEEYSEVWQAPPMIIG